MDRDNGAQFEFLIRPQGFAFERGVNEFEEIPLESSGETVELEREIAMTAEAFAKGEPLVSAREARKSAENARKRLAGQLPDKGAL